LRIIPNQLSIPSISMATAKKGGEAVMVVVRMRPFNTKETSEGRGGCIILDKKNGQVGATLLYPAALFLWHFFGVDCQP
jgi:hypothetical protein